MIIRKPYAFLIKYFKIIHIILFIFMVYLAFSTRNIYMFFSNYLQTGTYTYIDNMALSYVNPLMIIICIFLITAFLLVYFLMKQKEKKVLYYLLGIIFYFITFIVLIVFLGAFNNLEYNAFSNQSLVLYRDFAMAVHYLNYFFLVMAFIRGFGFNVKKFNFEKDLRELEISEEDREEIEVGSSIDIENVGNFIRRRKRNFLYYIKENSYILIVFSVIIILLTTFSIALNRLVISKVYQENELVPLDSIDYKITGSYIADSDLYGNIIKKNKKYLVVTFDVINKTDQTVKLSMENTRVKVGDEYYYVKSSLGSKFSDLGIAYKRQGILKQNQGSYILIFELNKVEKKILLQLYRGKKEVNGEAVLYYRDVSLNPYTFTNKDLGKYKLEESISLKNTHYKKGSMKINNIELLDMEKYTFSKCISDDNCTDETITIVPKGVTKLLKIKYEKETPRNIFNYLNIEGNVYERSEYINDVTPDNYEENTVLLEVPSSVNIENIVLYFNIRGLKIRVTK